MKKILVLLVIVLLSQTTFSQWSKGKGNGYYKLSAWYLNTDQHYTNTGDINPNVTRTQFAINLYTEYGLSDRLDLIGHIPFFARASQNDIFSESGGLVETGEDVNSNRRY